jgi:hypothetical protein
MAEGDYPRQRTPTQLLSDMVAGQPCDWEPGLVVAPGAGTIYEVYNRVREKRRPAAIRIQNVGTQAFKWAVNCAKADPANQNKLLLVPDLGQMKDQYTGVTSGCSAAEDGLGGIEIFRSDRVQSIFVYAANAYTICISKRYAQGN